METIRELVGEREWSQQGRSSFFGQGGIGDNGNPIMREIPCSGDDDYQILST